ncbi:MAG TPA: N-acetyltransferase [Gemmatimonadales bacterium]|nr:N-acetyltransferase [Gemmatimonadales bacterium]
MSALPLRALRAEPAALMRAARLADVPALETLMAPFVATGDLLPRSRYDLCRHIKEYVVAQEETERDQTIVACGSLKLYSETLAEIAGVAVQDDRQGRGLGRAVIETLVAEARALGLSEVFALTRKPAFFLRLGFGPAEKAQFPQKVWADCARCPRQACCDEIAVTLKL